MVRKQTACNPYTLPVLWVDNPWRETGTQRLVLIEVIQLKNGLQMCPKDMKGRVFLGKELY